MDKNLMTVMKMKKNFKCTLSHCEDCERECAGCNFWATLLTTDIFKGILGRSPEIGEDRKCLKRLTMHSDDYASSPQHSVHLFPCSNSWMPATQGGRQERQPHPCIAEGVLRSEKSRLSCDCTGTLLC